MNEDDLKQARELLYRAGLEKRREVLGDDWVDAALASGNEFTAEFQEMITRTAWQEIWLRDGLDEATRRLLTITITAATGRWAEFRLHVRSGLQREAITEDALKETLLQLAVYAGVPTANTAFKEAAAILEEVLGDDVRNP